MQNTANKNKPHVTVFLGLSLDGFIAGIDNDLEWLNIVNTDPPEDSGFHALMNSIDCMVFGRNTYDVCMNFDLWPYTGKRVVVLTSRPAQPKHGEEFYSGALPDLLHSLHADGVKHIYLDGGNVVRQGMNANIVDDMTLSWIPIILGKGIPLFDNTLNRCQWKMVASHAFASGMLQAKYVPDIILE